MAALSPDRADSARPKGQMLAIGLSVQSELNQIVMPRLGIRFPRQLPYEKWLGIGRQLAAVSTSSAWCLGDWLVHGEDVYSGRYRDAIEQTSLDYQTLRNYAWVARRFPVSRRRDTLSFAHHAEVARLSEPEQEFWLRKAEEHSWSRNRLRREVRGSIAERAISVDSDPARAELDEGRGEDVGADTDGGNVVGLQFSETVPSRQPDTVVAQIRVGLSPEQLKACQAAADKRGQDVEEWATLALGKAALELGIRWPVAARGQSELPRESAFPGSATDTLVVPRGGGQPQSSGGITG